MTRATEHPGLSFFPTNYRWAAAFRMALTNTTWGAGDVGEIEQVGRRLLAVEGDDNVWFREWRRMADHTRSLGQHAESEGHRVTAAGAYLRAASYYHIGERFRTEKDSEALACFRSGVEAFKRYAALTDWPHIEPVEVPFEGKSLPGYFVRAGDSAGQRSPCVVYFDGLDITKEIQYIRGAQDIVRRGVSVLVMDGPGTGEAIRFRGLHLLHHYEVAGSAAVDYLETRDDVDARRIGIMAVSLGGYYATRSASKDPRFKACVAWGAIWDYHAVWQRRIDASFRTALSVPGHHIAWALGVKTLDEAMKKLEGFRLNGVVQQMRCPLLILHGERDAQIPIEDARALYAAAGSEDKTLRIFTEEEGGAEHCQNDSPTGAVAMIADWLQEKLQ